MHDASLDRRRLNALRELLRSARERLKPADVGLESGGRRGCPGLRREEVAQLAGISALWYTRFETGQRRVSARVIERLCAALRLDRAECDRLIRLALPELDPSQAVLRSSPGLSGIRLARELKRIEAASTIEELCESGLRLVSSSISGDLFFADRAELLGSRGVAMNGAGGSNYEGRLVLWNDDVVRWQHSRDRLFVCPNLRALGDARGRVEYEAGFRSFAGAQIRREDGSLAAALGIVRRDVGAFTDEEVATLEAISIMVAPRSLSL